MKQFSIGWTGIGAIGCALISLLAIVLPYLNFDDGMVMLTSFPIQLAGLFLLAISLYRHRHWWLLITLPPLLFPLTMWVLLLYYCSQGACP